MSTSWIFDQMDGQFEARLRRVTTSTRSTRSGEGEITVTNYVGVVETRFNFVTLDRLYNPNFVAVERPVGGDLAYLIFEVVSVNPMHFQMLGMDVSMPTVLRREYLDTISESWGRSQETWIDLSAVPTWYMLRLDGADPTFERSKFLPLAGAKVHLLSKKAVEKFLCYESGENLGSMIGFDLPFTVNLENLIRYHAGLFGFSVDYDEPIIYRENGEVKISKIGRLVDKFYQRGETGPVHTSSIEVVCFDPQTLRLKWSPLQYVFRHEYRGKMLKFGLQTGRSVTVTPSHSLFILRDGKVVSVPASEIREGDFVIGTKNIPDDFVDNTRVDLIHLLLDHPNPGILLREVPDEAYESRVFSAKRWKKWKRWSLRHTRTLPLELASALGVERDEVRIGYKGCRATIPPILEIDEDLAKLVGYYVAEGHVSISKGESYRVEFTLNSEEEIIAKYIVSLLWSRFGITASVRPHGTNGIRVSFNHRILAEILAKAVGKGARRKRVPSFIFNSPSKVRRAFFRAWIEGDHGVTSSAALMSDMMYLLLFDQCIATSAHVKPPREVVIEGRRVRARDRFQLRFPRPDEVKKGEYRNIRKRAEPSYPAFALPESVRTVYLHPTHLLEQRRRLNDSLLSELQDRTSLLMSYDGSHAKDVNDARHDGFYRTNAGRFLVREGNKLHATQLLLEASDELDRVRGLARSELAFLEVVGIREVKSTSNYVYDVSVPGAENFLAGSGGVFCHNTGSGKSNLTSTLIRKAMRAHPDLTTVVFDVAGEYATHLVDLLESGGRILTHEPIEDDEQLFNSQAIPESLEDIVGESALRGAFSRVFVKGLVKKLAFGDRYSALDLAAVEDMLTKTAEDGKTSSMVARMALESFARRFYDELELQPNVRLAELPESAKSALLAILEDLRERSHEKSGLRTEVDAILEYVKSGKETAPERKEMTPERVAAELAFEKSPRLNIFYLPEPHRARIIASQVIDRLLYLRKRGGSRKKVLVVLDEAQEYIPAEPRERDGTLSSNLAVENLLRQGRKYRVHCWLATQRVARLNVSALQQLHSYFVSTLPRFYDRMVVAESFALPYEVLERSAQLDTGEWIFVSFKATKQKNVPVFVKTENNEGVVANYLKRK